jgi:hypothetical protein
LAGDGQADNLGVGGDAEGAPGVGEDVGEGGGLAVVEVGPGGVETVEGGGVDAFERAAEAQAGDCGEGAGVV